MQNGEIREQLGPKTVVKATTMEKIIVVAPTTAVPIRTGFAVALNVFPRHRSLLDCPSLVSKSTSNP